jgi:hypothetical protein
MRKKPVTVRGSPEPRKLGAGQIEDKPGALFYNE